MNNTPLLITGPSASGKTTLAKLLLSRNQKIQKVLTSTTRPPRPGEKDGIDYNFYSPEEFQGRIDNNEFLENALVYGHHYGVEKKEIEKIKQADKVPLLVTDVQGAVNFAQLMPDMKIILIKPESLEQIKNRLIERGSSPKTIKQRLSLADQEMERVSDFDYTVINRQDKLEEAVQEIEAILRKEGYLTD